MSGRAHGHRCFACFYALLAPRSERAGAAEHRRALLENTQGRVVEIGSGTGLNFAYYPAGIVEVLATEPDPHMVKRLRRAAERAPVRIHIAEASADRLPIEGASVDARFDARPVFGARCSGGAP